MLRRPSLHKNQSPSPRSALAKRPRNLRQRLINAAQKSSLRRLRRWRRAVGSHCLARRNLQNERRRSASLLTRRALKDRRAPSHGSDRRAAAVRLCAGGREGCGLKTPLTEREAGRNVEVMWLTGRLVPDHKTIADFRKDN